MATGERVLFGAQIALAGGLLTGVFPAVALWGLWALGLAQLWRFQGAYNGGADKMVLLILTCLAVARAAPDAFWAHLALSYLAVQLVLSYFISGWVKLWNPDWRSGQALADVFAFSAYPVSEGLRALAGAPRPLRAASWGVIGFELVFPLALASAGALTAALVVAALFHLTNACLFGLNRFLWTWSAAYPSLIWFQDRALG